jgi:hypothetical protein
MRILSGQKITLSMLFSLTRQHSRSELVVESRIHAKGFRMRLARVVQCQPRHESTVLLMKPQSTPNLPGN